MMKGKVMYQIIKLITTIAITSLLYGCLSQQLMQKMPDVEYALDSIMLNGNVYLIKKADKKELQEVLLQNGKNTCKITKDQENNEIGRKIIKRASMIDIMKYQSRDVTLRYSLGIDQKGDVRMVRLLNTEGKISRQKAQRIGLYLFDYKYEEDPSSCPIQCGEYIIKVENR